MAKGEPIYLAFDMGLGKSRTFIEAVRQRHAERVLIICPTSARLVWRREIMRWDPGTQVSFVDRPQHFDTGARYTVITHGMFSQVNGDVIRVLNTLCRDFDMTALDEAHAFNSANTQRVKALHLTQRKLGYIVPLSGTPIRNHAGDLYNMLRLCYPPALKTSNGSLLHRTAFEDQFCKVTSRVFHNHHVRVIEGSKNLELLKARVKPFMARVRKADVLKDLPPIIWDQVSIPVSHDRTNAENAKLQDDIVTAIQKSELGKSLMKDIADLNLAAKTLARMGNDPQMMSVRRLIGLSKLRGACEYLVDMLDSLPQDRKVLVFAVHSDVIAALKNHLGEYDPVVLMGSTTPKDRDAAVDKFLTQASCRVFVGNIQAAGTALTLVGPTCKCSDVVFVESSWTSADNMQAACRVHRIGQQDGVVVRMLTADTVIDDLIHNILVRKAQEFTQLFDNHGEVQ